MFAGHAGTLTINSWMKVNFDAAILAFWKVCPKKVNQFCFFVYICVIMRTRQCYKHCEFFREA